LCLFFLFFVRKTFCPSNILIRPHVFLGKTSSRSLIVCRYCRFL
jgi:hypothetical protein